MEVLLFAELAANLSSNDDADVSMAVAWLRDLRADLGDNHFIQLDKIQRYMLIKLVSRSNLYDESEK